MFAQGQCSCNLMIWVWMSLFWRQFKQKPLPNSFCWSFPSAWRRPHTQSNVFSAKSVLDWVNMEDKGFSHPPPVDPLASQLHPNQRSTMNLAGTTLPSQSSLFPVIAEKSYKVVATSVQALKASLLLLAHQAELEDNMATSPTPAVWEELFVVTHLCLRLYRLAVQVFERATALIITQERAWWLNLSSLSQKEKTPLLDVPVDHAETLQEEKERGMHCRFVCTGEHQHLLKQATGAHKGHVLDPVKGV